jgi:hypothetical protein
VWWALDKPIEILKALTRRQGIPHVRCTHRRGILAMDLADRMKHYEDIGAGQRLIPNLPVCIRLDGKAFHQWTRGLRHPYDDRLHTLFDDTTKFLVEASDAVVDYTSPMKLLCFSITAASRTRRPSLTGGFRS